MPQAKEITVDALPSTQTLQEKAYRTLKERIKNREFLPGQNVTDSQIAQMLNMSRTPVREALRRLDQEGFLVNNSGKGWNVYRLTLDDIRQIFDIRIQLEGMLARQAATSSETRLKRRLEKAMVDMLKARDTKQFDDWQKLDMVHHAIIMEMGRNPRAAAIIHQVNEQWHRVRIGLIALIGTVERSTAEHERLVTSILKGDEDAAEENMRSHLENVHTVLENVLINMVIPFAKDGI